ncbi:MAG TPA: 2-hydroxy-3-keto-5-methylthiopentenyl-1-phosphate phosphatase [Bacteroidetes bacterium]|jgi:2-hydroxy-3-keto-5-methylthiopentenyl-1-phosphate phosphatase|nr:2-hydroxy-3-keto-5-methylthiopentenyl-1-phosphate phosphatase [Bacteroidota bacterium]
MALKIFVDFDGTITKRDVGNAFFRKYVGQAAYDEMLREYKDERISAQECFRKGIVAIATLNRDEAVTFVRSQEIDPSFKEFLDYCRKKDLEFHIVSDGLDFYIDEILAANGIAGVSIFANNLRLIPVDGRAECDLQIDFPYADAECRRCASCKRNIMLTHSGDEDLIAYVGEGYSDQCPVQYADIVFAKDALQTYCQRENISYYLYDSFRDVVERLDVLLAKKRLRKRLAAEMKRKEIFMREP